MTFVWCMCEYCNVRILGLVYSARHDSARMAWCLGRAMLHVSKVFCLLPIPILRRFAHEWKGVVDKQGGVGWERSEAESKDVDCIATYQALCMHPDTLHVGAMDEMRWMVTMVTCTDSRTDVTPVVASQSWRLFFLVRAPCLLSFPTLTLRVPQDDHLQFNRHSLRVSPLRSAPAVDT